MYFSHSFFFVGRFILHIEDRIIDMNEQSLQIMRRLLRPASAEEQAKIARQRTAPDSFEQLTLADAGLVDEVRELVRRRKSGGGKSLP